jgi:pimeloyl-ACP methyl ester carboxylesterase
MNKTRKIETTALVSLIILAFAITAIPAFTAASDSWTLVNDARAVKAYPELKEYVWQKNATMAPNGLYDKIGLYRLVKTGVALKGVIFIAPSAFTSPNEPAFGTNPPEENWTKTENQSMAIYYANRGFDVYTMETRDYFVAQYLNTTDYFFNTTQLSFMANWGWDQWISDMKEAVTKTKEVSGAQKVFVIGLSDGGETVLNYATKYWAEDIRGIVLLDATIYGAKATSVVSKRGNETNTYNLTQTIAAMISGKTYSREFGGIPGWTVLTQYAEANPGAPSINPWTGAWLNTTAINGFTGKPFANITDWFANAFTGGNVSNVYGGQGNVTLALHGWGGHLRYAPSRLVLESQAMRDWINCPYLTYDFDDHWSEIGVPVLAFASQRYTNSTGAFRFVNGISNVDFTGIMLPNYMALDPFNGVNSPQDVSAPTYNWMVNHVPAPLVISVTQSGITVAAGNIVSFYAAVSGGVAPYTYQWYQGTSPVGNSYMLSFYPNTAGTYTYNCKITDAEGATTNSNTITLTVNSPQQPTPAPTPTPIPTQTPTPTPTPSPSPASSEAPSPTSANATYSLPPEATYAIAAIVIIVVIAAIALFFKKRAK